jgi:hypothetical protein
MSRGSSRRSSSTTPPRAGSSSTTFPTPRVQVPRLVAWLVVDYFVYVARSDDLAHRAACRRLLLQRRASGCLGTSCGSLSTTSPTPRVQVPRHVARLVTRLVAPLIVDYSASRRLDVDYFAYSARPGASARHAARRRLLRLRRASGCPGTSHGSSSTTLPTSRVRMTWHIARLVIDYFSNAARPGASALRAARRRLLRLHRTFGCLGSSRGSSSTTTQTPRVQVPQHIARLIVDYFTYAARSGASARRAACRRLLRLRRVSGFLGTSRCSSHGSSLTTLITPRVRVPRHVARLVVRLVVDYFDYVARPGASARRATRHTARRTVRRQLRLCRVSGCLGTSRGSLSTFSPTPRIRVPRHVARIVTRLVVDYSVCCDFVLRPH